MTRIGTIQIHGTDGRVQAPFGRPGIFIEGEHRKIRVIKEIRDEDICVSIQKSFIGMELPIIFSSEDINRHLQDKNKIPEGSMLAYTVDIIDALERADKRIEAAELCSISISDLDMIVFPKGTYVLLL